MEDHYPRLPFVQENTSSVVNLFFINHGSTYVHDAKMVSSLFYLDFKGTRPPPHDPQITASLKDIINKAVASEPASGEDVAHGAGIWNTYQTSVLTKDMIKALEAGTARIYLASHAEWTTNKVADHFDACSWVQPLDWGNMSGVKNVDPKTTNPVWHSCQCDFA
jgi:hypothetical protein